jgi:DNA polymerase-3 subunit epsilon
MNSQWETRRLLHGGLLRFPNDNRVPARGAINWQERFAVLAQQTKDERLKAYYLAGMPTGDTPIEHVPLLAMNIQTTGPNPAQDSVLSINIAPVSIGVSGTGQARQWMMPTRAGADDDLSFSDLLNEFLQAISSHVLVVHCRAIERSFLNRELQSLIHEPIEIPVIDTMELEARLHRRHPTANLWSKLWRKHRSEPVCIELATSRARYGLAPHPSHDPLACARATAELLQAQVANRYTLQTPLDQLWC